MRKSEMEEVTEGRGKTYVYILKTSVLHSVLAHESIIHVCTVQCKFNSLQ